MIADEDVFDTHSWIATSSGGLGVDYSSIDSLFAIHFGVSEAGKNLIQFTHFCLTEVFQIQTTEDGFVVVGAAEGEPDLAFFRPRCDEPIVLPTGLLEVGAEIRVGRRGGSDEIELATPMLPDFELVAIPWHRAFPSDTAYQSHLIRQFKPESTAVADAADVLWFGWDQSTQKSTLNIQTSSATRHFNIRWTQDGFEVLSHSEPKIMDLVEYDGEPIVDGLYAMALEPGDLVAVTRVSNTAIEIANPREDASRRLVPLWTE